MTRGVFYGAPGGYFSTWPAYKPLTDDSPWWRAFTETRPRAPKQTLPPAAFERHCDDSVAFMRTRENPWQGEGPARHCVRARLVLTGAWSWADADWQAQEIVGEALRRCGVTARPSWQEGQAGHCQPGYDFVRYSRCARCREIIPDERGRGAKYCSERCSVAAQWNPHREREPLAAYLARCAQRTADKLAETQACEHCGKEFTDADGRIERRRYCSQACTKQAQRNPQKRACPACQTVFTVKASDPQVCCSRRCAGVLRSRSGFRGKSCLDAFWNLRPMDVNAENPAFLLLRAGVSGVPKRPGSRKRYQWYQTPESARPTRKRP